MRNIWRKKKSKIFRKKKGELGRKSEVQNIKMLLHRGIPEKEPNNQKNLN